jgi:hypothetical protein
MNITLPVTTSRTLGAAVQTWTLETLALRGQTLRIRGLESTMTLKFRKSRVLPNLASLLRILPPYAIGSIAMFWVVQRITAF